jgi:hypothetical protein
MSNKEIWVENRWIYILSSRWLNYNSLGPRSLLSMWFQVRTPLLLIWWLLKAYMIVNFKTRGISRGARRVAWTPTLIKKNYLYTLIPELNIFFTCFNFAFNWVNYMDIKLLFYFTFFTRVIISPFMPLFFIN